jgi:Holliday junction resolvasome RuvABC endonuclease subunit
MIWGVDLGMRSLYIYGTEDIQIVSVPKGDRYLEIYSMAKWVSQIFDKDDTVFYEEPVLAGPKNIRTIIGLAQSSAALLSGSAAHCYEVPVGTWKKEVVGKGNAKKEEVAAWLEENDHPTFVRCGEDQNLIDAACIQKYGIAVMDRLRSAT